MGRIPLFKEPLGSGRWVRFEPYEEKRIIDFMQRHSSQKLTFGEVVRVAAKIGMDKLWESVEEET